MNSIQIIYPYKIHGVWCFDDEATGLHREPFVGNINKMIDWLVVTDLDDHKKIALTFSDQPFPGAELTLEHVRDDMGGNWYSARNMEGWLCPSLFKYFDAAPQRLYVATA